MTKFQKSIIIFLIVLLFTALILVGSFLSNKKININKKVPNNNQTVNINESKVNDATLKNGIELIKGDIQYQNGKYYLHMTAKNSTDKEIDCRVYRISFRDIEGNEIEFFSGNIIGVVEANKEQEFIVETSKDLSKVTNIYYEEFYLGE